MHFLERLGLALDFDRAQGACVRSADGRSFVDCVAGYGNLNVGHNHPAVVAAVVAELRSPRPFNWPFISDVESNLAERLAAASPGELDCVLVVNSGSEAVESALKLVRLVTRQAGVIAAKGAWHGFTLGAMSISEPTMVRDFEMADGRVTHVPFGDVTAAAEAIEANTGAVIVEPVQAESGALVPPDGYLPALQELCRERDILLVLDEIKTGLGKTGTLWACDREGVVPDVLLTGKSLGGGTMPIGALVAKRSLWAKVGLSFPMSASSGMGNAPACAAGLATLDVIRSEQLVERAAALGDRLDRTLRDLAEAYPSIVTDVSGHGLLLGLGFRTPRLATSVVAECVRHGVLVMPAFCNRARLLVEPPLTIADQEVAVVQEALTGAVAQVAGSAQNG